MKPSPVGPKKQKPADNLDSVCDDIGETSVKKQKLSDREDGSNLKKTNPDVIHKRYQKTQKIIDSNKILIMPERTEELIERDNHFAWNYFDKVEKTFVTEGNSRKTDKFISILSSFKPKKDSVADLYNKLEDFFRPDHPELADVFLTFLLPSHAAQVGKFFEHFILTNMQNFLAKLNAFYEKQPNQLKKFYGILSEMNSSEEPMAMETIKQKFLPLLKGNQLLTDWFLQLFPNEMAPEAQDNEFEVLQTKKDNSFEEIPASEIFSDPFEPPPCAIKYMQGRIYYGNRVILPADLSFMAVQDSEPESFSHLKNNKNLFEPGPSCVHAIKAAWDLKVQDDSSEVSEGTSKEDSSYRLCDNTALKMHSNRLNPPLHVDTSSGTGSSQNSEDQKSPRKTQSSNSLTAASNSGVNSTGLQQTTCKNKSNPISPKKNLNSSSGKGSGTPKKLPNPTEIRRKYRTTTTSSNSSESETSTEHDSSSTSIEDGQKSPDWTRDEDKLILEEINSEIDSEDVILEKLVELMPDRNRDKIVQRFHFLINVLKKFECPDSDD